MVEENRRLVTPNKCRLVSNATSHPTDRHDARQHQSDHSRFSPPTVEEGMHGSLWLRDRLIGRLAYHSDRGERPGGWGRVFEPPGIRVAIRALSVIPPHKRKQRLRFHHSQALGAPVGRPQPPRCHGWSHQRLRSATSPTKSPIAFFVSGLTEAQITAA